MSDEPTPPTEPPDRGDNLAHINKLTSEMTHAAGLWSNNAERGAKHERDIMVRAYELCLWAEQDPANDELLAGRMVNAGVPHTKRSHRCTQTIQYAFAKLTEDKKVVPEPNQISRWGWAIQHALNHDPRPAPGELLAFIKKEGGDAECRKKARKTANDNEKPPVEPKPYPLPCELPDVFDGKMVKLAKTKDGGWQMIPRKVVSLDTTSENDNSNEPDADKQTA
jgi:hypothetical protein